MDSPKIRLATQNDLPAILDIYNHYVANSTCTYQETPDTPAARMAWFAAHGPRHPVTVAEREGAVVGWAALSVFHPRSAYRFTVENAVYVHPSFQRQGLGRALLRDLIARAQSLGHRSIIALISAEQSGSVALHAAEGFVEAGRLKQVGIKFDQWLDVLLMQKTVQTES